ncbi:MAG: APC family permease [Microcoleaceae cyanobacterium]
MLRVDQFSRFFLGKPLPTSAYSHERLSNVAGLAILASDALSSVAYATEEILLVLVLAGSGVLGLSLPISGAIVLLLGVVTLSYRQTIRAYPSGGGAYTVAYENLGRYPGLVAAASLLVDYVLTVTVSVSAGIAALTSAVPGLSPWTVELCLLAILLLTVANLRGLREAGRIFLLPTYGFIATIFLLIAVGLFKHLVEPVVPVSSSIPAVGTLNAFLILRAFAAGCTAMTGVEAISNGILVFKSPEWKNARNTLLAMAAILGYMFLGITYLTQIYHIVPTEEQTVLSLLGRQIFGDGALYYLLQTVTLLILLLAANTSFADFPRLAHLVAKDGYLPRQLASLGDRLVYSNGIRLLSLSAAALVIVFGGRVDALIPLYAVGVFTSFTLSQAGMVRHWFVERSQGWRPSAVMNGLGAIITAVVLLVIVTSKFRQGAWLIVVTIPLLVRLFLGIRRHYETVAKKMRVNGKVLQRKPRESLSSFAYHPAIVLVGQLHQGTIDALDYACLIADQVVAVHVDIGTTDRHVLQEQWQTAASDIELIILDSPYRSMVAPLAEFVRVFEMQQGAMFLTVIIPVVVTRYWWENLLHNQTALFLRDALRVKGSRIITTVRYFL